MSPAVRRVLTSCVGWLSFGVECLRDLFEGAGFDTVLCEYVHRYVEVHIGKSVVLRRVFVTVCLCPCSCLCP
jgi:hypothetical protein